MATKLLQFLNSDKKIHNFLVLVFLVFLGLGIWKDKIWLLALPFLLLSTIVVVYHYRLLYWILIGSIPLSITMDFSRSLSTDFPTEFLCIGLTAIFWVIWMIHRPKELNFIWNHNILWALAIVWIWSIFSSITAVNNLISLKYILAKVWYITSFLLFTFWVIRSKKDIRNLFWVIYIPLFITAGYSFFNTVMGGFDFEHTNHFSLPFYDNHVIYASIMTLILPFVFVARDWYRKGSLVRLYLNLSIPFLLIAIYFSYTRACYLALIVGLGFLVILRWKKMITAYIISIILTLSVLFYFSYDFTYLRLAPDYNTTVMHNEFKDHLISTFYGKDASSMERLNMWVGVFRMYQERPISGFGPNNFSSNYKPYTVMYFKTWVSDNPLNLSCHNYFWLTIAEQGLVGVFIFLIFLGILLFYIQKIYFQTTEIELHKLTKAIAVSIGAFIVILFFNDLIENSKVGSLFFVFIALLIRIQQISTSESNE